MILILLLLVGIAIGAGLMFLLRKPLSEQAIDEMVNARYQALHTRQRMADMTREAFETMAKRAEEMNRRF